MATTDTAAGIARPLFVHVVAGMHIGPMTALSTGAFDAVLTVGAQPGAIAEGTAHKHVPLSYQNLNTDRLAEAVSWVRAQIDRDRVVLIRSEAGLQRPALVVGMVVLDMGGYYLDAIQCIHRARPTALSDFRYLALLRAADVELHRPAS